MAPLAWSKTDIGRRRSTNEDAVLINPDLGLYVVADGMGGHLAGEVAAEVAVAVVAARMRGEVRRIASLQAGDGGSEALVLDALRDAVEAASEAVHRLSKSRQEYKGMGSTLSAAVVLPDRALVAHVGDSRVYLVRKGEASQLTVDHTFAAEFVRRGLMTEADARTSPHRNRLARAVGTEPRVMVDVFSLDVTAQDVLVLCTDGLSDYLEDVDRLAKLVSVNVEKAADRLVELANSGGGRDNISVVVVEVQDRSAYAA